MLLTETAMTIKQENIHTHSAHTERLNKLTQVLGMLHLDFVCTNTNS